MAQRPFSVICKSYDGQPRVPRGENSAARDRHWHQFMSQALRPRDPQLCTFEDSVDELSSMPAPASGTQSAHSLNLSPRMLPRGERPSRASLPDSRRSCANSWWPEADARKRPHMDE